MGGISGIKNKGSKGQIPSEVHDKHPEKLFWSQKFSGRLRARLPSMEMKVSEKHTEWR